MTSDSSLLAGWGRTAPSRAELVRPAAAEEVLRALRSARPRGVIARGLGRSYGDAAQNAGGLVVDTRALDRIRSVDVAAATATVEAGVSIDSLIDAALPHGLFVPVTPGTRQVTIGGAIAADVHGKNHHLDGSFARHVLSLVIATPQGELLSLTPETHPDELRATAGGMGLTGVVVQATIRLMRIRSAWIAEETERARDVEDLMARMSATDDRHRYSVAWIDCMAGGGRLGRSVLMRGDHARPDELPPAARSRPFARRRALPVSAPPGLPSGLLCRELGAAFNELYFRRAAGRSRRIIGFERFFHPLDGIRNWNRLYGPRGLVQYQLAVPFGSEWAVRAALERLSVARVPSFLGVFKRFGEQEGLLSFPLPGWTLAVDFAAGTPELGPVLDRIDQIVAEAGGRVYLAKDSRLRPELLEVMYPQIGRWREIQARMDPHGLMRSDLSRRLGLVRGRD